MTIKQNIILGLSIIAFATLLQSAFIVSEREQALVLQFGRPVSIIQDAGLKFKIPFIQNVEKYDARILEIDPQPERVILSSSSDGLLAKIRQRDPVDAESDENGALETTEKILNIRESGGEPIIVDTFARYKIIDPLKFRQRLGTESAAKLRLQNEMDSTTRDILGSATLQDLLSEERVDLMNRIRNSVNATVNNLGIEIIDIRIGRADLTANLREATYNRMRSEREQQATELRALGEERALEIRSNADKQRTVLLSEAERRSRILKGEGEEIATKIYADAYTVDEDFYGFYRSLLAYERGLDKDSTTYLLSPDSEFFKYFGQTGNVR